MFFIRGFYFKYGIFSLPHLHVNQKAAVYGAKMIWVRKQYPLIKKKKKWFYVTQDLQQIFIATYS